MHSFLKFAAAVLLAAALAVLAGLWAADRALNSPLSVADDGVTFEIPPGSSMAAVSRDLASAGLLEHPRLFNWYARLTGKAGSIHAGEYRIDPGTTPVVLLKKFVDGDVRLYSFTIVEGWTFRELLAALADEPALRRTLERDDWPALLESLGSDVGHPEGLFLPETYRFPRGTTDAELLRQAYELMQEALAAEWAQRRDGLPIASPYEALTLASIVEKETARADERARIAGVFVRRLNERMRLQTDPTVIYGLGDSFDGNLTRRHLRTDTPYNTYTRHGLPPTPIALPGRAAIRAALNPADGNELYFVATGLGDGSHKFSATKDEHDAAVREYLARQRAQRGGQ